MSHQSRTHVSEEGESPNDRYVGFTQSRDRDGFTPDRREERLALTRFQIEQENGSGMLWSTKMNHATILPKYFIPVIARSKG